MNGAARLLELDHVIAADTVTGETLHHAIDVAFHRDTIFRDEPVSIRAGCHPRDADMVQGWLIADLPAILTGRGF
jgi:hypothetical protein